MPNPSADRNMLFGVIALEMDFITRDQMVAAMNEWMLDKSQTLGEVLVRQGSLLERRRMLLDNLVLDHIEQHDNDLDKSLKAICSKKPIDLDDVTGILEPELDTTLSVTNDRMAAKPTPPWSTEERREKTAGGRFRVYDLHEEGGLGRVMIARDEEVGRTVAVKEIKPKHADNPVSRERFVLEAEITGGLEHPCIIPVYSLGKYDDGRPFYAMRFVRGENLKTAIEQFHKSKRANRDRGQWILDLQKLLRRFIDLCNAIRYAHSRGVIHRDVKPMNVMLGKFGETIVLDWGLAKVVGHSEGSEAGEVTLQPSSGSGSYQTIMGSAVGTPPYMSPEQAAGKLDELNRASDIYSLGSTLYAVLTGKPPYTGKSKEILDKVKKNDFLPPRQVAPEIPRPLEAICLKAMSLDPEDRYASPAELVEDIEHWIADEPVAAYRETFSERCVRWMRRHRTWVQAGAATLIAATVFFAVAAMLVTRAWRNEAAAREESVEYFGQTQDTVDGWVIGAAQVLQYYPGTDKPRERLLARAAEDYELFTRRHPGHRDLEFERGRTYLRLGDLRVMLNDSTGAAEAYKSAAGVFESLKREHPNDLVYQVALANCRTNQGVLSMMTNHLAEADQAYQDSITTLDDLLQQFPEDALASEALVTALSNRAELLLDTGELTDAEKGLRKAVDLLSGLEADEPKLRLVSHRLALVRARDLLGQVLLEQGHYEKAVQELRGVVETATELAEDARDNPECLDSLASTKVSLGLTLRETGDYDGEVVVYRLAIDDYRTLLKALPGAPHFQERLGLTLTDLGGLLYKLERADEAIEHLDEAQQNLQHLATEHPLVANYVAEWAFCSGILGRLRRDRGQFEEAKDILEQAIQAFRDVLPSSSEAVEPAVLNYLESLAFCRAHLGQTLCLMGLHDDADLAFQEAVATLAGVTDKPPDCLDNLALIYEHWGTALSDKDKHDEASNRFQQAKDAWAKLVSSGTASADHRHNYARFLTRCPAEDFRDDAAAVKLARELTDKSPKNAMYWNTLAVALYRNGDWHASSKALEEAMGKRPTENGRDLFFLAMVKWQLNDKEAAVEAYQRGADWLENTLPNKPDLRRIQREAAESLGMAEK